MQCGRKILSDSIESLFCWRSRIGKTHGWNVSEIRQIRCVDSERQDQGIKLTPLRLTGGSSFRSPTGGEVVLLTAIVLPVNR